MKTITILLLLTFTITLLTAFNASAESMANSNAKKVLLVYGGWEGHQPKEFKDLILPWLKEQGFDVTV